MMGHGRATKRVCGMERAGAELRSLGAAAPSVSGCRGLCATVASSRNVKGAVPGGERGLLAAMVAETAGSLAEMEAASAAEGEGQTPPRGSAAWPSSTGGGGRQREDGADCGLSRHGARCAKGGWTKLAPSRHPSASERYGPSMLNKGRNVSPVA